jgi:preprotein translocase subunit SecD
LTEAGAKKLHDLMAAQLKNLVAMVVDSKVLWAPTVTYVHNPARRESAVTGNARTGLTEEEVERIMAILR